MNNEAQMGLRFAVKGAKQVQKTVDALNAKLKKMGVSAEQTGKKMEAAGEEAQAAGKKQNKTFDDGIKKAGTMSKSLDKVVRKWLSVGGAITLVHSVIRRAFSRIDELTGLNRMAKSAGVAESKIYGLGRKLKELYGGDASSAAGAYTSLGDILGAARSGRGISQDVVAASSRYGIALNGGMLTEEQLMTNIARAMQTQRNKGNMYGVRDIASAFGIDEAMMLHLSKMGANWDRGLPAFNAANAQKEAARAREIQEKLGRMVDELVDKTIPLITEVMTYLKIILEATANRINKTKEDIGTIRTYNEWKAEKSKGTDPIKQYYDTLAFYKSTGLSDEEAKRRTNNWMYTKGLNTISLGELEAGKLASAHKWAEYYNNSGMVNASALNNVRNILNGVAGTSANVVNNAGKLEIEIIDKAGVLRNTYANATYSNGAATISTSTNGL